RPGPSRRTRRRLGRRARPHRRVTAPSRGGHVEQGAGGEAAVSWPGSSEANLVGSLPIGTNVIQTQFKDMSGLSNWPRNRLLLALPSRNLKRLVPELEHTRCQRAQ